jgi:uncharacterized protein (TIGR03437 family)
LPAAAGALPGYAPGSHPVKAGDTLLVYAIGLGPTNPAVPTGTASPSAEPFARLSTIPQVAFGTGIAAVSVNPIFAGLAPGYVGEYQVNVTIPSGLQPGVVNLTLVFPDSISNSVPIVIQ